MTAPLSQVLRERKELSELMAIDAWAAFADLMQGDGQKEVDMALLKLVNEQAAGEIARDPVMLHMACRSPSRCTTRSRPSQRIRSAATCRCS